MAISDKLARIKEQATDLSAKTDALNATIGHIDDELAGSGVEFWWPDHSFGDREYMGDTGKERDYRLLGYTKVGGDWCLALQDWWGELMNSHTDDWNEVETGEPVPLRRAPRSLRIEVAPYLEQFLEALSKEIERMSVAVDKANKIANPAPSAETPVAERKGSGHADPRPRQSPVTNPSGHANPNPKR